MAPLILSQDFEATFFNEISESGNENGELLVFARFFQSARAQDLDGLTYLPISR